MRRITVFTICAVVLATAAPALADPPYPAVLPDFAHPSTPHYRLFSPYGGNLDRPVLVIHVQFDDMPPLRSDDDLARRFFGGAGARNAQAWYREQSYGRLRISPAREAVGARDGVVRVNAGPSGPFFQPPDITSDDPRELGELRLLRMNRRALELAAAAGVDFSGFDTRPTDGRITNDELIVVTLLDPNPAGGGAVRSHEAVRLNGKDLALRVAIVPSSIDLMTLVHELGHALTDARDFYGFGVGSLALWGPTGPPDDNVHGASAYEKVHLGWLEPTVVVRDGYYSVRPSHAYPDAFVLYDPTTLPFLAQDRYFLVENRELAAQTYDEAASDRGLVIWRVADRFHDTQTEHLRPVELMRPDGARVPGCIDADVDGRLDEDPLDRGDNDGNGRVDEDPVDGMDNDRDTRVDEDGPGFIDNDGDGRVDEDGGDGLDNDKDGRFDEDGLDDIDNDGDGRKDEDGGGNGCSGGSDTDAWDPGDPRTPQRTMSRPWLDGAPSNLAVRAIERPAGDGSIRAFFDVRGPYGVLADCFASGTGLRTVYSGRTNTFSFPVMNTGESPDTFQFSIAGPSGWTPSAPVTRTLAAGQGATVVLGLTAPAVSPDATYTAMVTARSTTAGRPGSQCFAPLAVTLDATAIQYLGPSALPWGEPAGWRARAVNASTGAPVAGAPVRFRLVQNGSVVLEASATTDSAGTAAANPPLPFGFGPGTLFIDIDRVRNQGPASLAIPYTVTDRRGRLAYTGQLAADYSDPLGVSARLVDARTEEPLARRSVGVYIGGRGIFRETDANGMVAGAIVLDSPAGLVDVTLGIARYPFFPGWDYVTVPEVVGVDKETIGRFTYTGDSVTSSLDPRLAIVAEEEPDGSPGDIDRATAALTLRGLLSNATTPVGTADVDPGGGASVLANGLLPDVYGVDVAVPAVNTYWEGGVNDVAELVVYDPSRFVTGEGLGGDDKAVEFSVAVRFADGRPTGFVKVTVEGQSFTGTDVHWLVAQGGRSVIQAAGEYGGEAAVLRLRAYDESQPGAGIDHIAGEISTASRTVRTGDVVLAVGEIVVGTSAPAS